MSIEETFETEVLKSELPVLVDFMATWCQPCKKITPIVDQLSEELQGKVKVVKIDIDLCPNAAKEYGLRSVPTLMVFKDGLKVKESVGTIPKKAMRELVEEFLDV